MDDAEAVELHDAAGSVLVSQSKYDYTALMISFEKRTQAQLLRALTPSFSQFSQLASPLKITQQQTLQ